MKDKYIVWWYLLAVLVFAAVTTACVYAFQMLATHHVVLPYIAVRLLIVAELAFFAYLVHRSAIYTPELHFVLVFDPIFKGTISGERGHVGRNLMPGYNFIWPHQRADDFVEMWEGSIRIPESSQLSKEHTNVNFGGTLRVAIEQAMAHRYIKQDLKTLPRVLRDRAQKIFGVVVGRKETLFFVEHRGDIQDEIDTELEEEMDKPDGLFHPHSVGIRVLELPVDDPDLDKDVEGAIQSKFKEEHAAKGKMERIARFNERVQAVMDAAKGEIDRKTAIQIVQTEEKNLHKTVFELSDAERIAQLIAPFLKKE